MSKKSRTILYTKLLYKMGQNFLDIDSISTKRNRFELIRLKFQLKDGLTDWLTDWLAGWPGLNSPALSNSSDLRVREMLYLYIDYLLGSKLPQSILNWPIRTILLRNVGTLPYDTWRYPILDRVWRNTTRQLRYLKLILISK